MTSPFPSLITWRRNKHQRHVDLGFGTISCLGTLVKLLSHWVAIFFFFLRTWHNLPLTAIGELSSLTRSHACCGGLAEVSHILGGGCVLFFSDLSSVLIIIPPESVISWLINKWTFPLRSLRTPSSLRDSGSRGRNGIGYTYTYHLGDTRKALTLPRPLPSNRPAGADIGGRVGCVPLEKRDWW